MNKQTSQPATSPTEAGGVNMTMIIHIAVELLVTAGLAFWIYSRTNKLQEEIKDLKETINKYEEVITKQGEFITRHENALAQIFNMLNPGNQHGHQPPPMKNKQPQPPRGNQPSPQFHKGNPPQQFHRGSQKPPKLNVKRPKVEEVYEEEDEGEQTEDEENVTQLDDLLAEELQDLRNGSQHDGSDSTIVKEKKKIKKT